MSKCSVETSQFFSDVEVIVVDNASIDNTGLIVKNLISECEPSCRYVYEERLRVSFARNRGRIEARGKVIAYTDDDAVPRPEWLSRVREHFLEKKSDYMGGRVELALETPLPPWFPVGLLWVIGQSGFGDKPRILESESPISANCAIFAEVFDLVGGYDNEISYYGEEVNFFYRLKEKGFVTMYRPDIIVDHYVPSLRLTKVALRQKAFLMGHGAAQIALPPKFNIARFGRLFATNLYKLSYVGCAWLVRPRFDREFTFLLHLGYLARLFSWHR